MSDRRKLTPRELRQFSRYMHSRFPYLVSGVTSWPNMEWKIDFNEPASPSDIEAVKATAQEWYQEHIGTDIEFGRMNYSHSG